MEDMRPTRLALITAAVALGVTAGAATAAPPARPPATTLVALERPTPVREYDGWLVYSRWDGSAYRLAAWHDGQSRDLAAPAQSTPFDADAGPDSSGNPSAVYAR